MNNRNRPERRYGLTLLECVVATVVLVISLLVLLAALPICHAAVKGEAHL